MRCGSCNKFVSIEIGEPDVQDLQVSGTEVSTTIRLTKNCAECSTELADYTFEIETSNEELDTHNREECSLDVEEVSVENTTRTEGKNRGTKTFYGVTLEFNVTCTCQDESVYSGILKDEIQASAMEDSQ